MVSKIKVLWIEFLKINGCQPIVIKIYVIVVDALFSMYIVITLSENHYNVKSQRIMFFKKKKMNKY